MNSRKLVVFILTVILVQQAYCKTTEEWKHMSIYQIITDRFARTDGSTKDCEGYIKTMKYCGGTWVGIKNKIDYIANMGFDAIWISPVWKNLPNSYHGYSIIDLEKLNEHFGTDQDFKDMINAAHAKKINVMIDVVPNHMGSVMFDYQKLNPFNKAEYFHDYCYINDGDYAHNQWRITNCRLLNLPDLKQEHPFVRKTMLSHVENFVRDFSVDGLRLDAVPHIPHWFLKEYYDAAKKGTVTAGSKQEPQDIFIIGECFDPRYDFVNSFQSDIPGLFNFPMFFNIIDVYKRGKSTKIISAQWKAQFAAFKDVDALGLFIDNHDNQRFLFQIPDNEKEWRLKNALAFIFYVRGIPTIYYGTEQGFDTDGDPYCRQPLWPTKYNENTVYFKYIALLNQNRKQQKIVGTAFNELVAEDTVYAFTRGSAFVVTRNSASAVNQKVIFKDSKGAAIYKPGDVLVNIEKATDTLTVGTDGSVTLKLTNGFPIIYNLKSKQVEKPALEHRESQLKEEENSKFSLGL